MSGEDRPDSYLIWDWTVRLCHWMFVLLVPLMWWTAEEGLMDWHRRVGMILLGLIVFRLVWGMIGAWTARFLPMLGRIPQIPSYVRDLLGGQHRAVFGHNPIGVLSVLAMLTLLCVQIGTGLFAVDVDGLESGPLAVHVSFEIGREVAEIHELSFDILSIFVILHVLAILVYRFVFRDNLIGSMVTGYRTGSDFDIEPMRQKEARPLPLVLAAIIATLSVYFVFLA